MPEKLKILNIGRIADSALRNVMATTKMKEYTEGQRKEKKYKNIMAEHTSPPGTKEVTLPKGTQGPRNIMATPGKLDRPGAAAALYEAGLPGKGAELEESSLQMRKLEASIDSSMATMEAADQKRIIEQMSIIDKEAQYVASEYDRHISNGRTPKQAQELVDTQYEQGVKRLSDMGIDIAGFPPAFERKNVRTITTLKERVEMNYKEAQTEKVKAETAKIKRETGKKKLTAAQESNNAEIDNARRVLRERGVNKTDIKRLTTKSTETGRENPDYDPDIARQVSKALQRKVGDDPGFKIVSNIYQLGRPGEPAPELKGAEKQLKSKNIVKRGTYKGRKVIQYEDGSVEYAD